MADVHSKKTRSYNMSRIRSKNTKPEIIVRKFLFSQGFRYRLHDKKLPGKPDIVLPKYKTIIFVNGCFWHGHKNCKYFVLPKTRSEWWENKIKSNQLRDINNKRKIKNIGWNVIVIFECRLKKNNMYNTLTALSDKIKNNVL